MTRGQKALAALVKHNHWIADNVKKICPDERFRFTIVDTTYELSYDETREVLAKLMLQGVIK